MNKMQTAANIILEDTIHFMATFNGVTEDQVFDALKAGNVNAMRQFKQLAEKGAQTAEQLHLEGKISLL